MAQTILVTGGAGYIGSHTCIELLAAGHRVVVIDSLVNASRVALDRVAAVAGRAAEFHQLDLLDATSLLEVVASARPDAVIHFAGLKAVGESVAKPLEYYRANLTGTINLLAAMREADVRDLVFSSSATVYGDPERVPITEDAALRATSPYGRTKLFIEEMLRDLARADTRLRIALLRYFNPVGAHPSGTLGEDPRGVPNNLMPYVMQVAIGRRPELSIFGNDWPTPDGTGVRDYIHVVDLARGHLAALAALPRLGGCQAINLGTGRGHSVLELVRAAGAAAGRDIPHRFVARRPGDIASAYADPARAAQLLGWRAERTLSEMCADSWRWQSLNPQGYASAPQGRPS